MNMYMKMYCALLDIKLLKDFLKTAFKKGVKDHCVQIEQYCQKTTSKATNKRKNEITVTFNAEAIK